VKLWLGPKTFFLQNEAKPKYTQPLCHQYLANILILSGCPQKTPGNPGKQLKSAPKNPAKPLLAHLVLPSRFLTFRPASPNLPVS
jgi:hypothetical protein